MRARRVLAGVLARTVFDVVICHSHWAHAIFAPVVRRAGRPLVFWLHEPARGRHWIERWARRTRPHAVVCNSAFTARSVATIHPGVRTEIVHPPVPLFPPAGAPLRAAVRAGLGVRPDVAVIVQVSRLEGLKGHDVHLDALGRLADLGPRWQCWMVGGAQRPHEAERLRALQRKAADLGIADRVRFLGERTDVPALLRAADVLCQPNTRPEAFGVAFVEGLAAGLPVVTSALGGALEVVDESCGFLVPPGDAAALASVLRRLVADPALRARTGAAGPARARRLCDPAAQLGRLDSVLASIVAAPGVEAVA
jgi:glycosyltransferase involved in cell wall biosynthesis